MTTSNSPAINEIHTQLGADPDPGPGPGTGPCPGLGPGWSIRGLTWWVLQEPVSAMLQGNKQTVRVQLNESGVRCPGLGYPWFQRGQRCEFTASSGFNTHSELDFLLCTLYIMSPTAGELEGQPTQ